MFSILKIQTIEPSLVVHKLISEPLGTYIIRTSTENDDILSKIKYKTEKNSPPYVVLFVRVNQNETKCQSPSFTIN